MNNISKLNISPLGQRDSRWAGEQLGTCGCTIGSDGCLITCMAMIANYSGKSENPSTINSKLRQVSGYASGCLYKWYEGITKIYSDITCEGLYPVPYPLDDGQEYLIDEQLSNGYPVVCEVDYNPATIAVDMHWVLIVGKENGTYRINDPWTGREAYITSRYGAQDITINYFVFYKGPKGGGMTDEHCIPKETFEKLVGNSTKWDETCKALGLVGDPKDIPFKDVQNKIAGYKARETDLSKQLATSNSELDNRIEQVSRLKAQLTESENLRKDLSDSLNEATKKVAEVQGLYEARLDSVQGDLDTCSEQKGELNNDKAELAVEVSQLKSKVKELANGQCSELTFGEVLSLLWAKITNIKLRK